MSDTFGPTSGTPLATYDHDSRFWRTLQATLVSDWERYSETLPRWGTTRGGVLYELPTPGPLTDASAYSSLPTPRSVITKAGPMDTVREQVRRNGYRSRLEETIATLPTPTAWLGRRDAHSIGDPSRWHNSERSNELSDCVAALLPTPTVMDMGSNYTPEEWEAWKQLQKGKHQNGNGHGASLTQEALKTLPTPTVKQGRNATSGRTDPNSQHHDGWTLQDVIYAGLIGVSTRQRSEGGSPSSDDPLPPLPFDEETATA